MPAAHSTRLHVRELLNSPPARLPGPHGTTSYSWTLAPRPKLPALKPPSCRQPLPASPRFTASAATAMRAVGAATSTAQTLASRHHRATTPVRLGAGARRAPARSICRPAAVSLTDFAIQFSTVTLGYILGAMLLEMTGKAASPPASAADVQAPQLTAGGQAALSPTSAVDVQAKQQTAGGQAASPLPSTEDVQTLLEIAAGTMQFATMAIAAADAAQQEATAVQQSVAQLPEEMAALKAKSQKPPEEAP